ncbi:MAG: DUF3108 domain-containing protein [candidate division FCPU426 bacterium]
MKTNLWILIGVCLIVAGCATGRTDFKIIKASDVPTLEPTPVAVEPLPEPTPAVPSENTTYCVVAGDTLWHISGRLLGDPLRYPELAARNRIANPDLIHPGQVLELGGIAAVVPGVLPAPTPAATATVGGHPASQPLTPQPTPAVQAIFPQRPNQAFAPGEKLLFSVEYLGIAAGFATLSVEPGPIMNGRQTLHLIATARTHPAFEWFFKVRDRIESFFDAAGLFSWRYEKHLREGGYSNDSVLIYDQVQNQVIKDEGRTRVPAAPLTQDVLSEFYFYRAVAPPVGQELTIPVVADDGKSYEVIVKSVRREKVRVPAGEFNCIVVQPQMKFEGVFQSKGEINIWLTDDVRRVPVLVKSAIIIGTIDVVLRDAVVVDVGK